MSIFCKYGTFSAGISTPRSPLATMIPSAQWMISSIFLIPSAFSIFAMIGIYGAPHSFNSARISRIPSAERTNDAAIKSIPCSTPKMISSRSFFVSAGRRTGTFGTLTPFLSPSSPPFNTLQVISLPLIVFTSSSIRPSSIRILLPGSTSSASPSYVMDTFLASPSISSVVSVNSSPASNFTFFPSFSKPVRISGPFVSSRIAIGFPISSRTDFRRSILPFCSS